MKLSEREKTVVRGLLERAAITENELLDAGYYESEVEDLKNDYKWQTLYGNIENSKSVVASNMAVISVLGKSWKDNYDYDEKRKEGKYYLSIYVSDEMFSKICEIARNII